MSKVLLINGSPHARGCTATALGVVAGVLEQNGIVIGSPVNASRVDCQRQNPSVSQRTLSDESRVSQSATFPKNKKMDDKQQIEALYKQMYRAMIAKDKATMTGRSRVNAAVYGGGRHTWRLQIKSTLVKKNGRWLFVEQRALTY